MKNSRMKVAQYVIFAWLRTIITSVAVVIFGAGIDQIVKISSFPGSSLPIKYLQWRWAFLIAAGIIFLAALCDFYHEYCIGRYTAKVEKKWRSSALTAYLQAEPTQTSLQLEVLKSSNSPGVAESVGANTKSYLNGGKGKIISNFTDSPESIARFLGDFIPHTIASFTAPFLVLIVMALLVDWLIALVVLLFVILVPLIIGKFMKKMRRSGEGFARANAKVTNLYLETFENLGMLRLLQAGSKRRKELEKAGEAMRKSVMQILIRNQIMIVVNDFIFALCMVSVACVMALWRLSTGGLSMGAAFSVVVITVLLHEPIDRIGRSFYVAMGGLAQKRVVENLIKTAQDIPQINISPILEEADNAKIFGQPDQHCNLQYPECSSVNGSPGKSYANKPSDEQPRQVELTAEGLVVERGGNTVINEFGIELRPNTKIAVVGPSGGGKTTLISAISGRLAVKSGDIFVNGKKATPETIRKISAVVTQSPVLFSGTIAENMRIAKPNATTEELWKAIELAQFAEEIRNFPAGINTQVGEKASKISGGQLRRLGLARAFLKDAPILVLDEPTADLDKHTEELVTQVLPRITCGKTVLIVAHRLETLTDDQEVLILEEGKVTAQGKLSTIVANAEGFMAKAVQAEKVGK